jgi:hypothetical protein
VFRIKNLAKSEGLLYMISFLVVAVIYVLYFI